LFIEKDFLNNVSGILFQSESLEFENKCFRFSVKSSNLVNTFIEESAARQPGFELQLQSLSTQIAVTILREGSHSLSGRTFSMKEYSDTKCVRRAIEFLTEHCDKNITLNELAREVNYSPYHFLRVFKKSMGITPFEFLLNIKIEKAKSMIRQTNYPITQICYLCGFSSASYFTQVFKKKTGVCPSCFKKNS
jgi:AraC-like DNA-binding protein